MEEEEIPVVPIQSKMHFKSPNHTSLVALRDLYAASNVLQNVPIKDQIIEPSATPVDRPTLNPTSSEELFGREDDGNNDADHEMNYMEAS